MDAAEKQREVLNRSRRDRLTKAAKQGYGPWADMNSRARPAESAVRPRQAPTAAVSENAPRAPLLRQQQRSSIRKATEDETDLSSFLAGSASKPPAAVQKRAQGSALSSQGPQASQTQSAAAAAPASQPASTRLELKISVGTNERALAARLSEEANAGARPKAANRPSGSQLGDDEIDDPEQAPRCSSEEEEEEEHADPSQANQSHHAEEDDAQREAPYHEDERDRSREERRQRQREEKRKREEWRKAWREDRKRRAKEGREPSKSVRDDDDEESDSMDMTKSREQLEHQQNRAMTWSVLNNFGVTTARDAQKKYVGQVSDADLDRRLREQQDMDSRGQKLMSEAEVLAKMQRTRTKRR